MKKKALFLLLLITSITYSQKNKSYFPAIEDVTVEQLKMTHYVKDSSAIAVVLDEQSYVHFNSMYNPSYTWDYYVKIKILKKSAFKKATIRIPFYKSSRLKNVSGITYNLNDKNEIVKSLLTEDAIFKNKYSKNFQLESFALPNVKVGSVMEVKFSLTTKNYGIFDWKFQTDIPKIKTVYKAHLPSNPRLKVRMIGFLKPTIDTAYIKNKCFEVYKCTALHYEMKDVPAFIEEAYLTSKNNYISRISFEREYNNPYKKNNNVGDWKNLDKSLKNTYDRYLNASFFYKKNVPSFVLKEKNELRKANLVYTFIQRHFALDEKSKNDLQTAFKTKTASSNKINLSLYNALKAAEINNVKLVLLSTRKNGFITKLHATIEDFDHIIVRVVINGKKYFLDATNKENPFGLIPFSCLNGEGRVLDYKNGSYWEPIKSVLPTSKTTKVKLSFIDDVLNGTISITTNGYNAATKRNQLKIDTKETIIENFESKHVFLDVNNYSNENLTDLSKNLVENYEISINVDDTDEIRINPFFEDQIKENPFKLSNRQYPIDFGYKRTKTFLASLEIPTEYKIKTLPKDKAISLPNKGGTLIFKTNVINNSVTIYLKYQLNKEVYTNKEYAYLKGFYNQLIQIQRNEIVLEKKH